MGGAAGFMAGAALGAAALIGRERQHRRTAAALEAEIERLQDRAFQVLETEERYRALAEARARAEAASEAKSRFLATVSHEVRTPLNGILGMADLALDTPLTPEQATYLRAIRASGEALLSLINEILDFSKIEAGHIDLHPEPFDLAAVVEGVAELLAPRAQGKGLEIASLIRADVPGRVVGDVDRLRQVLVNLAGNAVKFTESGGVGILVERDPRGGLAIAVADTGPGLDPAKAETLFREFEQGDASPSQRHGGTGLGLAITRRIVEHMGGTVAVTSAPGRGATFRVTLPLAEAPSEPERRPALHGRRVLVVARSAFEAPYLAARLAEAGARPELVEGAAEAAAALSLGTPDLVIVDYALGDEAARAVASAARRAGVARSLVLLQPFDRRGLFSPRGAGFDGYLVKPVRARSLFEQLADAPEPAPPADTRPDRRPVAGRPGAGRRVLLAEDNEINALLATRALEKLGAGVDRARDGREALILAEAALTGAAPPYDLVLMDVRMPGLDGLAATQALRRREAALGRPPLRMVALTANTLREDHEAARRAGLDEVLAKPFDLRDLARLFDPGLAEAS